MTAKELLKKIEVVFAMKLSIKTGWDRLEVIQAYKDSVNEVLMEMVELK